MKIIIATIIILSLFIGSVLFNAIRIGMPSFGTGTKRLREKSELLSKKAETFEEKSVLQGLGVNSLNGLCYRFDGHLKEAVFENKNSHREKAQKDLASFSFEFNSYENLQFRPTQGDYRLEGGVLKFKYVKGDYLQNSADLSLVKDTLSEIELRIKLKEGKKIQLSWSVDNRTQLKKWITIDVIPDNTFHVYRINLKNVLKAFHEFDHHLGLEGEHIKKFFLRPSDVTHDSVEIDYIRFISKRAKYHQERYGETYETINREMRKVVYTTTPARLRYTVDIPQGSPFLTFGMGILERDDPVRFKVLVQVANEEKELYRHEIGDPDNWHDTRIDFSEWSGRSVKIVLETESEKGNSAFWSNPVLAIPPKERFNVIIVLEDALRSDHMSSYGYVRDTSQVKDVFIKKGVLFLNAFSQATETRPSCPSLMTSLYPTATGVWNSTEMLHDNYLTLAEIMRSQGFATAAFIQNGNAGPYAGLHQGFCSLFDATTVGRRAEELYGEKLYGWIKAHNDRNFFIYLHLIDPHGPYDPPRPFDTYYREGPSGKTLVEKSVFSDPEWVEVPTLEGRRLLYDGEIRYNDFCFEGFLKKLQESALVSTTLIAVIADHGEHLGEHGLWGHHPPGYRQGLQVPLLMVYPDKLPMEVKIHQPVQLIDIMPTVLDLANIDRSTLLIEGDSLLSLMHGEELNFWDNRLAISEEVVHKGKNDTSEWASIFYRNWHILRSNELNDGISRLTKYFSGNNSGVVLSTRVFNYFKDKGEEHYLNSFLFDLFFQYKVKDFIRTLQENNMALWKAVTRGTKETIKYDPEELERLRAIGYVN